MLELCLMLELDFLFCGSHDVAAWTYFFGALLDAGVRFLIFEL